MSIEWQIILTIVGGAIGGLLTLWGVQLTLKVQKEEQVPTKIIILNTLRNDLELAAEKIQKQINVVESGNTPMPSIGTNTLNKKINDKEIMDHWLHESAKVNKKTYEALKNLKHEYENNSLHEGLPKNLTHQKLDTAKKLKDKLKTTQRKVETELKKLERKIKS